MKHSHIVHMAGATIFSSLLLCLMLTTAPAKEAGHDNRAVTRAKHGPSLQSMLPDHNTGECGATYFDGKTGTTRRIPDVDLVVTRLKIIRNERGTWVQPWVKNRCSGAVTKPVHVSVGDVVVTISGLAPNVERTAPPVGVRPAARYTAVVDQDHRIAEADESNNRCTRSSSGRCR